MAAQSPVKTLRMHGGIVLQMGELDGSEQTTETVCPLQIKPALIYQWFSLSLSFITLPIWLEQLNYKHRK